MKKHILIVSTQLERAGAQRVALMEARYFHEKGYQVTLCFLYDKQNLIQTYQEQNPFTVLELNAKKSIFSFLKALWYLFHLAKDTDIIHTHSYYSNLIGIPLAGLAGVPVRLAAQHTDMSRFPKWFWRVNGWLVNSWLVHYIVAVSPQTAEFCIKQAKMSAQKVIYVPNGVDLEKYHVNQIQSHEQERLRQSLRLVADTFIIVTVARLHPEKGHKYLIEAMATVSKRLPNVQLLLVGDGWLRSRLEQLVKDYALDRNISFLGLRDDIPMLLSIAHLFILPSASNEAMPLAILEAMAMGVPVIATNVGGVSELLENRDLGYLAPPADAQALTEAIISMVEQTEKRENMSQMSRLHVENKFSWHNTFTQYELLFSQL